MESTANNNTGEECCGYCLEKIEYMVDLRELPCSHVFCLPCLQADLIKTKILECSTCKKKHGDVEVEDLVKVDKLVLSDDNEEEQPPVHCDVCRTEQKLAVTFCIDCEKRMCTEHEAYHDEYQSAFSRTQHRKISVEEYKRSPDRFTVRTCSRHEGEDLVKVCRNCHQTFCNACNSDKKCSASKGKQHEVEEISELSKQLKVQLSRSMNSLSSKISHVYDLEKKTTSELEAVEDKVTNMNNEADRFVSEQIEIIKNKGELLKTDIQLYRIDNATAANEFVIQLRKKKDYLGKLWKSTHTMLTQRHDSDIISEFTSTLADITSAVEQQFGHCQLPLRKMLIRTAEHRDLEVQLKEALPFYLELVMKENMGSENCICLCPIDGRNLLCGRESLLEILDGSTFDCLNKVNTSSVNGVAIHKQGYLALHWENEKNYIILYSPKLTFMKLFGEFFRSTDKYSQISASSTQVIAMNPDEKQLNVYNEKGEFLFNTRLTDNKRPWGVHSLADGTVLITDFVGGCLRKYKLTAGKQEAIWICPDLMTPVGIATDSNGLIYVSSFSGKRIYMISHQGIKIKELTHPELQNVKEVYDISVSEEIVSLACGSDGVLQFQMKYEALVR